MLPRIITCCAVLLDVTETYFMMCSVVRWYQVLLHAVQCCYMLHCVAEFCASVLDFVMYSCMLRSVVTCYIVLLNFVQQCFML